MESMIMTAQLLLSLSILVMVHEWGHYIAARAFNIKVEKFYIFFDFLFPMTNLLNFSLFKIKRGDTEFGVGWFPLGGYVKIAGMMDESMDKEQLKASPQSWEFRAKPAWQRLIVMLGGVLVNVVVGVLSFIGITYWIGDTYISNDYVNRHGGIHAMELGQRIGLKTGDKILKINDASFVNFQDIMSPDLFLADDPYYIVSRDNQEVRVDIPIDFMENFDKKDAFGSFVAPRVPAIVESVLKGTVADRAGLQKGDQFIALNGHPVAYNDQVRDLLKNKNLDSISFTIKRGTEQLSFNTAFYGQNSIGFYAKGIPQEGLSYVQYSLLSAVAMGTSQAFNAVFLQLKAFKKIFSGDISLSRSLSGPIGIAQAFGSRWDWERFWRITGLLSMVLAFMNLLPIPALDGGHVVFLLYEMITGREFSEKFSSIAIRVGMALLLLLMVFVFYNDIFRLIDGS